MAFVSLRMSAAMQRRKVCFAEELTLLHSLYDGASWHCHVQQSRFMPKEDGAPLDPWLFDLSMCQHTMRGMPGAYVRHPCPATRGSLLEVLQLTWQI